MTATAETDQVPASRILEELDRFREDVLEEVKEVIRWNARCDAWMTEFDVRLTQLEEIVAAKIAADAVAAMPPEEKRRYAEAGLAAEITEAQQ